MIGRLLLTFTVFCVGFVPCKAAEANWHVPIFVYHRFDEQASGLTTIHPSVFAEQLAWLKAHGVAVLPLHDLVESLARKTAPADRPTVALTADDGHRSIYTEMFPLLRRYGVHATLFIYPSAISNSKEALTWEQLEEMTADGSVDVQSHTYWHPNFVVEQRRLAPADFVNFVRSQLTRSKDRLESRLHTQVDLLAWPFGLRDAQLEREAERAGYKAAFTLERLPVQAGANVLALPRFLVTNADRGPRFAALVSSAFDGFASQ